MKSWAGLAFVAGVPVIGFAMYERRLGGMNRSVEVHSWLWLSFPVWTSVYSDFTLPLDSRVG